jgi:hypothetical protein
MMASAAVIVNLRPGDDFPVREYPADDRFMSSPHVAVDLVDSDQSTVWVRVSDPAAFDGLITAMAQARDWLAAEISSQVPLPVAPEPVGNTGLTLGPLPVGVA